MEKVKMSILRSHKPTSPFLFIFLRVLGVSVAKAWPGIKTFLVSILPSRVLSRNLLNTLLGRISFYRDSEPAWAGRSHRQRRNLFSPFLMHCIRN